MIAGQPEVEHQRPHRRMHEVAGHFSNREGTVGVDATLEVPVSIRTRASETPRAYCCTMTRDLSCSPPPWPAWLPLLIALMSVSFGSSRSLEADESRPSSAQNSRNHWAFQLPPRPEPPPSRFRKFVRNPIDAFVHARLEREKLTPSPEADKPTLLRRLHLDLTGLPPSPAEVDAFMQDRRPDAYSRGVEKLLDSPHYGERWGRHWLDAARYADSNGFEKDRTRTIWPYRDWVIRAVQHDLPFDQFTLHQLAGDLLPHPTTEQRVATGFLRNSMLNEEGGVEPEKFRVDAMIDRVDAVGRTWLGLTIACAQCHDHKYDPVSQREYFRFYSLLNQDAETHVEVPTPAQAAQREAILKHARELESQCRASIPHLDERLKTWVQSQSSRAGSWIPIDSSEWHSQPMKYEKQEDLSFLGGGDATMDTVIRVWWDSSIEGITGFRLEAMTDANLPLNGPGLRADGSFNVAEFVVETTPLSDLKQDLHQPATNRVEFARAMADAEAKHWEASKTIDGETTRGGWANAFTAGRRNQSRRLVLQARNPVGSKQGLRYLITIHSKAQQTGLPNQALGRFRISYTTAPGTLSVDPFTEAQRELFTSGQVLSSSQQSELFQIFRLHQPELVEWNQRLDDAWKGWPSTITSLALQQRTVPRKTRIFHRGDWTKPTEIVEGGVPAILPPLPLEAPRNRLGLAQWLVSTNQPLTARVMVNRVWQTYFGQGLVPTPEDFGTRAESPSHPELLNWLAWEWMSPRTIASSAERHRPLVPWSLKHLHRLIVHSWTYRQRSNMTPEMLERDPYNRLLARASRFRVEAEVIQDIALKASELLSPKVGGPSVFPPLPEGFMQLAYGPIPWNISEGEDRYRRSLYTFWKRSVPFPTMVTFDAPPAEQSCVRRTRSNTPLQALTTLNEPTFNHAARWLAYRAIREGGDSDRARLNYAFKLCVARAPAPKELQTLARLLEDTAREYEKQPQEAARAAFLDPKAPPPLPDGVSVPQLAAWASVARALLNLDETVTRE